MLCVLDRQLDVFSCFVFYKHTEQSIEQFQSSESTSLMKNGGVCFVGAGAMASAIAGGLVAQGVLAPELILMIDPNPVALERVAANFPGIRVCRDMTEAASFASSCQAIFLAVKPQIASAVMVGVHRSLHHATRRNAIVPKKHEDEPAVVPTHDDESKSNSSRPLIVSVMAGITVSHIQQALGTHNVVRVMPNTPMLAGHGACAYFASSSVTKKDEDWVKRVFGSLGFCAKVSVEEQLHGVTALSASGPAFVAAFVEALADGGVRSGLPRDLANDLACHTVLGTAHLLRSDKTKGRGMTTLSVKEAVCSPGGTTIAGVMKLEEHGLRFATMSAVQAAALRSHELSKL